jgi:asparagine synthase (glutamine-hydrolysing)
VLGGYARYFWGPVVDDLRPLLLRHADEVLNITGRLPSRSLGIFNVARRAAKMAASVRLDTPARYLAWFDLFTAEERRALVGDGPDAAVARYESLFDSARDLRLDPVQRLQYVDCQTMLLDNLLMKADKLSMAHSLEVRVPFLTPALVEFGLGLPRGSKIGALSDKRLMRRLLQPRLGTRLANRPKRGFEIPVDRWFRERAADALRAQLPRGRLVTDLGFDAAAIDVLISRHLGGEDIGRKLFALTALERWAQRFV